MKDKSVILVVDDQLQNIELLEAYLVPQGYAVVKAANGEEALEKLSSNPIDLILLDIMMPGMDGFEVTRRVRQDGKTRLLPIILVTALRETEDRIKGIEAGCDDFISKPVDKMELLARVRSLLKVKAYNDLMSNYQRELESAVSLRTDELNRELRYRRLFETAQDGILIFNALTGDITDANPFLINMLGYSKQELLGKKLWEIGFIKDSMASHQAFQIIQEKGYIRYENLPLETRAGKAMDVEFVCNVYPLDGETVIQCNIRDITKRKNAEEEVIRSNKELEQFAYVASHDLREPLRMITSFAQLLEKRYKDKLDSKANEYISFMVDGSTRMQNLIDDLLRYSRVGTQGKPFEPTEMEAVLEDVIASLKVSIEESKTKVTHDPLPLIRADDTQMNQVLQNLISNAIKYRGDEPPQIHITAVKSIKEWVFSVTDNGIGIDPQLFDRLFILFQRLQPREKYPGTGIGLAVAKKIVERHGGRIWVDSQPGQGSTFFFTIPLRSGNEGNV